jgi:hypothetical protein
MIQDQLVEYIDSQLKAGITAETLKTTLVGAGWQAVDVDDTMKKVQAPQGAQVAATVSAAPSTAKAPAQPAMQPQVIRVSDLVSTSSASPTKVNPMSAGIAKPTSSFSVQPMQVSSAKTDAVMTRIAAGATNGSVMSATGPKKSHAIETETILGILMVVCGVAAAFLFFQNRNLSGQIATLNGTSGSAISQLAEAQSQLSASTTALEVQIASTTANNDALALELSFYAAASGTSATTTFTTMLTGTVLGGGKISYVITTAHGAKVYVSNSKDVNVIALLKPLVGGTAPIQFSGNYIPGADTIALTAVNGVSTTPVPVAATSSAGLMIPATSTTP